MNCEVLSVKQINKNLRVAHVKAGDMFGDVPCDYSFVEQKPAKLKPVLRVHAGRIGSKLFVVNA